MSIRTQLAQWLNKQTKSPRDALSHFTLGGFLFVGGMMTLLIANKIMADGVTQELLSLAALVLVFVGGAIALWGYLRISLFRILLILTERKHQHDDRN